MFVLGYVEDLAWALRVLGHGEGERAVADAVRVSPDNRAEEVALRHVAALTEERSQRRKLTRNEVAYEVVVSDEDIPELSKLHV